jgi:hypothetical protein
MAAAMALAASGWWIAEEVRYKRPEELERRPYPLRAIDLEPPAAQGGLEYFGKLRAELYIGRDGAVDRVQVLESTLPVAITEKAARAFAATRWEPGVRGGRRVRSVKVVEVEIEPPGGARRPMRPDS